MTEEQALQLKSIYDARVRDLNIIIGNGLFLSAEEFKMSAGTITLTTVNFTCNLTGSYPVETHSHTWIKPNLTESYNYTKLTAELYVSGSGTTLSGARVRIVAANQIDELYKSDEIASSGTTVTLEIDLTNIDISGGFYIDINNYLKAVTNPTNRAVYTTVNGLLLS